MSKRLVIALTMTLGLLVSVPLFAHHGSPHLLLMLDVKGDNGEATHWVLESQSPTVMYPSGYRKDSFKPGDEVTVTASGAKNGKPIGCIIDATTADGTKLGRIPFGQDQ